MKVSKYHPDLKYVRTVGNENLILLQNFVWALLNYWHSTGRTFLIRDPDVPTID